MAALPRYRSAIAAAAVAIAVLAGVACDVDRDRPTGLSSPVPETLVEIASPQRDAIVPSDSVVIVLLRAGGLLNAVEIVMRHVSGRDTIVRERRDLAEPTEQIDAEFEVRIPALDTGTNLEFIGVAENVLGSRRESQPVAVTVIDCQSFQAACPR